MITPLSKIKLDVDAWARRDHFKFFNQFEEPFYGVCVHVDCTNAYKAAKQIGVSFYMYYLHKTLVATNNTEAFRYRIENTEDVVVYSRIDGGSTIGRPNGTFGFAYFEYYPEFGEFLKNALPEAESVKNATDLVRSPAENVIRVSPLPWIDFTSLSHARMFSFKDSCPKISFGKMTEKNGRKSMPVSIHVHHALVDGLHVGQFIDCLQQLLNESV